MKKMLMRSITMLLVLVLLMGGIVAADSTDEDAGTATGIFPLEEPVSFKVLTTRWGSMGDSFTQNQWLIDLEESTNVQVEWSVFSLNVWGEQKAIMLAGQELPDIAIGSQTFNDGDILSNIEYFVALDELIENHMPNLKEAMDEMPELRQVATFTDGHIYSLPKNLPSRPMTRNQPIINKVWLDNLGLEVPDTIDDLTEVLIAFAEQDANGNGDANDEIPITGNGDVIMDFLNPFGITDVSESNMMIQDDGSLVYYPTSESYKDGIKWLHELYVAGAIDPETFTQDQTQTVAKYQHPENSLVGMTYAWTPDSDFGQWSDEYIAISPIAGPDGERYAGGDPNGVFSIGRNEAEILSGNENPEIAAAWLDQFYTGEASIQNFWGAIGTVISKNDDGTYTLNDPPEGTSADAWYWDQSLRDFGPKYISADFQETINLSPDSGDGLKVELSKLGDDYITTPFPTVMYTVEETEELGILTTDIGDYIGTMRAEWITNGGIDEGWDSYVAQLEAMNLERLIEIRTEAYNSYNDAE